MNLEADHVITIDMLNGLSAGLFQNKDEYIQAMKKIYKKIILFDIRGPEVSFVEDDNKKRWFLIYIPKNTPKEEIVHESVHLAMAFLERIGYRIRKNDEILAYLTAYIFKSINEYLMGKKIKR